jgi:tripartite-type tricarboxylate transporter receptor subunit TctC
MPKVLPALLVAAVVLAGSVSGLLAQGYPNRPINLIIPMAPGDGVDVAGRIMADGLATLLKVAVTPLNKPGAGGVVGTDLATKSKNDGYTLLIAHNSVITTAKILHPEDVNYDPFKDLTPLGLTTVTPTLITAKKDLPFKHLRELVEYSKKNPGKVRCGTPGVGTLADFNVPIITNLTGADISVVPFKGASPAITALLGGHIEIAASAITPVIDHLRSGEARGLVISKKLREFPMIPTLKELGYQQDIFGVWFAFFAPAGIPTQAKERLVTAIEKVTRDPAIVSRMAKMGLIQEFVTPDQLFKDMAEEYKVSKEIARTAGLVK